jgi:photosystem II stability/assembly factor-like uncharacterized protein
MASGIRAPALVGICVVLICAASGCALAQRAAPAGFEPIGLGGGGGMFAPASSPHDPNLMFVACDMSGVYRSEDGGRSWQMIDKRQLRSATSCPPMFHPTDPNVVYACGEGVLRVSSDRGVTWRPLVQDPPWGTAAITALGMDPGNPNLMFAGTGADAYCSHDGGRSWDHISGVPALGFFVDPTSPTDSRTCFVAAPDGVYRSDDSGKTWREATSGLPRRGIRGFCGGADPGSGRVVLYCTVPSGAQDGAYVGGVYRSLDRGDTWESAMGEGINKDIAKRDQYGADSVAQYSFIAMAANHPDTVYVTTRGTGYWPPYHWTVYRTDDAGAHWRSCFTGDPRFENPNVQVGWLVYDLSWGWGGPPIGFSVNPAHPDVALYTNAGELYVTDDGARTWRCAYCQPARGRAAGAGVAWLTTGLDVTSCWQFAFDPSNENLAYIAYTDIGFARSEDRGRSWEHSVKGCPWSNTFYQIAFDPARPGTIYAACSSQHDIPHWTSVEGPRAPGGVCVSTDYGKTWQPVSEGLPAAPATSIVLDPKSPEDSRTLYVASFGHGVFKSTDGAKTWRDASAGLGKPGNMDVYSVKLHADGTLFCSITGKRDGSQFPVVGGLYRSTDGAQSWTCITDSQPLHWAGDFDFDPRDSRTIYIAAATAPQLPEGGIYKTTNGGASWERMPVDFPTDMQSYVQAFFVRVNPKHPDTVYLSATTHGLFVTTDAGKSWREVKGIPFTPVQRVTIDPVDENTIWVTSFGGGVWKGPALGTE